MKQNQGNGAQVDALPDVFVHPQAIVEASKIGEGTRIWAFSHLLPGCVIGRDCNICDHTFIENDVVLGDRVTVKCGVYIWNGVVCESDVFLGPNVTFTNDLYPRSKAHLSKPVLTHVCEGASIGANVTIVAGLNIGKYAMIGSGSTVVTDVPDYALYFGNPAKQQGFVSRCGAKLEIIDNIGTCPETNAKYVLKENRCAPLD